MKNNKLDIEIKTIKKIISMVKRDYGKDTCKDICLSCPSCQGNILLGLLIDYLEYALYDKSLKGIKMPKLSKRVRKSLEEQIK